MQGGGGDVNAALAPINHRHGPKYVSCELYDFQLSSFEVKRFKSRFNKILVS